MPARTIEMNTDAGDDTQADDQTDTQSTDTASDTDASNQSKSLEDLLADLPEESRKAVLDQVQKSRKEAAGYRSKLREAEPLARRAKELEDAKKSAEDKANEKATQAQAQAAGFRDRAVKAEVKALAAADFADPEDAAAFLSLDDFVNDDGDIDTEAIRSELAALLQRKPHLARAGRPNPPRPDHSQGSTGNGRTGDKPEDIFASFVQKQLNR